MSIILMFIGSRPLFFRFHDGFRAIEIQGTELEEECTLHSSRRFGTWREEVTTFHFCSGLDWIYPELPSALN